MSNARWNSIRSNSNPPPQLLSDPAHNTRLLNEQLNSLGLYAAPTLGDGNCLFRALSDQIYGTDSKHSQLRQDVCDWIEGHKTRYEPFVEDERGLDVHLRCMRENGEPFRLSIYFRGSPFRFRTERPVYPFIIHVAYHWASAVFSYICLGIVMY